jgi:nondiscriminating glutamyl-tRNA synthetase
MSTNLNSKSKSNSNPNLTNFRTRQAPSPTGYLHLGTARTVLFTQLLAIINNGSWYLRLEDTDRARLQPDSVKILLGALEGIGLSAKEGIILSPNDEVKSQKQNQTQNQPDVFYGVYQSGEYGPYIQSQRLAIYHEHANNLIEKKLAYWSYLTAEEKKELQDMKQAICQPIDYFTICSQKNSQYLYQSVENALKDPQKPVLMYRLKRDQKIICNDQLLGDSEFDLALEEDFTILKSDGFPTYHFAHLVDDYLMKT